MPVLLASNRITKRKFIIMTVAEWWKVQRLMPSPLTLEAKAAFDVTSESRSVYTRRSFGQFTERVN